MQRGLGSGYIEKSVIYGFGTCLVSMSIFGITDERFFLGIGLVAVMPLCLILIVGVLSLV